MVVIISINEVQLFLIFVNDRDEIDDGYCTSVMVAGCTLDISIKIVVVGVSIVL